MPTKEELKKLQSDPLPQKVLLTKARIREWYYKWGGQVYVSFSGGKDSTVLLHLVRQEFPDVQAVFVDTGLEYPEIKQFVKQHENVKILRPKMGFANVIRKYGYPVLSKAISNVIYEARFYENAKSRICRINGTLLNKDGTKSKYNCEKYKPLLEADFVVSDTCCRVMKKSPAHTFERKSELHPVTAQMACESMDRTKVWLQHGCNAFDAKHPISNPMSFWTEQDVLYSTSSRTISRYARYMAILFRRGGNYHFVTEIASFARLDAIEPDACSADMAHISKRARDVSKGSNGRTRSCMTTASEVVRMTRRTACGSPIRTDWAWLMSLTN